MAAALLVVSSSLALAGTEGSESVQITSLSAGSRFLVTPAATIAASHRIGAPSCSAFLAAFTTPGDQARSATRSVIPHA
jgi:hypothetical protein